MIHFGPGKITIGGKVVGEVTAINAPVISKFAGLVAGYVTIKVEPSPPIEFQVADREAYEHFR